VDLLGLAYPTDQWVQSYPFHPCLQVNLWLQSFLYHLVAQFVQTHLLNPVFPWFLSLLFVLMAQLLQQIQQGQWDQAVLDHHAALVVQWGRQALENLSDQFVLWILMGL